MGDYCLFFSSVLCCNHGHRWSVSDRYSCGLTTPSSRSSWREDAQVGELMECYTMITLFYPFNPTHSALAAHGAATH